MRTITANLKQSIFSPDFLVSVAGVVLIIFLSSTEAIFTAFRSTTLLPYGYHTDFILSALSSNAMALALPILCALPYTAAIIDDVKSGFIKAYLPRTTMAQYLTGKITACALSGGLTLLLGVAIAWGVCALILLPREAMPVIVAATEGAKEISPLWGRLLLYFGSGALWALTGMLFATLTQSKYMAHASPFVIYYVLIILYERYFDKLYVIYPKEWLSPSSAWMYGDWGVVILLAELTVIAALCTGFAAKRRLSEI